MKKPLIFLFLLFSIISLGEYDFNHNSVRAEKVYTQNYSKDNENTSFKKNNSRIFLNKRFLPKINKLNTAKNDNWWGNLNFLKIGFYLLIIIGILIFVLFMKYLNSKDNEYYDFDFDSEMPIFHPQISEKEYQKAEFDINNTDENLPFEVVWKQNTKQ